MHKQFVRFFIRFLPRYEKVLVTPGRSPGPQFENLWTKHLHVRKKELTPAPLIAV